MRYTTKLLVAALLGVAIVLPLLVGVYDRENPTLFGFPFFYWFQFALIPVASICTYIAYRLVTPPRGDSARAADRPRAKHAQSAEGQSGGRR